MHSAAPKGAGYPANELSSKQKSSSRPASAVKKKILQARPPGGQDHLRSHSAKTIRQELAKEQLAREAAAAAAAAAASAASATSAAPRSGLEASDL